MKTNRILCILPLCAAALLAQGPPGGGFGRGGGFGGFEGRGPGLLGAGPGARTPIVGAPYSATETVQSQQTLANGNQISRTHTSTVARDSVGRISTSETFTPSAASGKAAFTIETIFDPVAGYRYELDSATMIAMQTSLPKAPSGAAPAHTPPARPNVATTSLGSQVINGVAATGTQLTETIPAGAIGNTQAIQVVRTTWVSTELKIPVEIKTSDPRFGSSDLELTNIVQAEPSGSLFVVPTGYTVKQGGGHGRGPEGAGRRGPGAAFRQGPAQ